MKTLEVREITWPIYRIPRQEVKVKSSHIKAGSLEALKLKISRPDRFIELSRAADQYTDGQVKFLKSQNCPPFVINKIKPKAVG